MHVVTTRHRQAFVASLGLKEWGSMYPGCFFFHCNVLAGRELVGTKKQRNLQQASKHSSHRGMYTRTQNRKHTNNHG